MAQYRRNVSPYGDLELPLLGRVVKAGEVFEVTPEQAKALAGQDDNFEKVVLPATSPTRKRAAKKAAAAEAARPVPVEEPTNDEGAI